MFNSEVMALQNYDLHDFHFCEKNCSKRVGYNETWSLFVFNYWGVRPAATQRNIHVWKATAENTGLAIVKFNILSKPNKLSHISPVPKWTVVARGLKEV